MRLQPGIILTSLVVAATPAAAQRAARAEALVGGWIEAAGGPALWDAVRDLRYTITTVWYDSAGTEVRRRPRYVWIQKTSGGFRVRVERTEAEGRYVQIWNEGAHAALNGQVLPDSARAVRELQLVAGDLTYWIGLPWKLRDAGVNLSYAEADGARVVHVTFGQGIGVHDGDRYWYYWRDLASAFPTEVHYIEQGHPDADRMRVLFRDARRIGPGWYFSRRVIQNAHGRTHVRELVTSDVVINRGISAACFAIENRDCPS
jgi:hypothetical protein